ncbi:hypothetical protein L3X38_040659 [Prunus dulcis]|uniref:Integrase catalytic domain-containing protein n=1 Tax=Prunus dulcis TaxID=3755 RepID=A0AAD4VAP7_PRUDU|nr:hypothetical protein L3X38_040659 [Prunus dulcis]
MLVELRIQFVEILGDSMLVLKQIAGEYKCLSPSLAVYLVATRNLLTEFREATWEHIPREENFAANELAQIATGIQMPKDCVQRIIKVGKKSLTSVLTRGMKIDVNSAIITQDDWRNSIMNYLQYQTLPSEKRIIVATDYFTKWVEAKPVRSTTSQEIITFIEEQIIERFGIPESITTDRGSSFVSREMLDMAEAFKFKLLQSTPYYAQGEATGMTPYALTYGHDAILTMEITVQSLRITHQHNLVGEDYSQACC